MPETSPLNAGTPLLVKQVRSETPDVVTLTLVDPGGGPLPAWQPGAHLDLVLPSGITRQYSLCGDDLDKHSYTVAVLHEPDGRGGSREVHNTALVGKTLHARGPRNHFPLEPAPEYLLIAGGIGITPLLAMARQLERAQQSWRLLYLGRREMPFVDQLRAINTDRLTVVRTDQSGRPDLEAALRELSAGTAVYCCGPPALITDVIRYAEKQSTELPVRFERFTANPDKPTQAAGEERPIIVELARSGCTVTVPPGQTILDAVRERHPDVPSSCEEGFCGTCETRVLSGIPDHRDDVLGPGEKQKNQTMMICISRAKSDRLRLDI
jgi:ferredoxin-NADP reductase